MRNLNALAAFREVAKAGGYAAAERATGQSRATLSRNVIALEEDLGVRLIERSRRSFRLTEPGTQLFARCDDLLAQIDEAVSIIDSEQPEPRGLVHIAIPPSLLQLGLGEVILGFQQKAPKVRLHIEASNREVDLRHEAVDFVVRARSQLDYPLDFVPVSLLRMERAIVAHPRWRKHLRSTLEETLEVVPTVAWNGLSGHSHWRLLTVEGAVRELPLEPRLIADDISTLHASLLEGLGMGIIPRTYVEEDIALGRLDLLNMDLRPMQSVIHAVHLGRHGMRPAVSQLLDWLKASAKRLENQESACSAASPPRRSPRRRRRRSYAF